MNTTTKTIGSILLLPFAFSSGNKKTAQCASAEEEAAELQKIMESQNGGMPADPEEMQELLMKARGQTQRKPPQFMRVMMPLKMLTMARPNDGFQFACMVPFSQRFQAQFSWVFSNKKAAEFETMLMLAGTGNMMNEDEMSFINATSTTSGMLGIQSQCPLPYGIKFSSEAQWQAADAKMFFSGWNFQKDFNNCHIQYSYQHAHILSYMQNVTKNLVVGFQAAYLKDRGMSSWSYAGKYEAHNKCIFLANYTETNPHEKLLLGVVGKPSQRLHLFAQLNVDPMNKTDSMVGFRARFMEGHVTGSMSTSGKATSQYKRFVEMFEVSFTSQMDFRKPQTPISFGVGLQLGGGM